MRLPEAFRSLPRLSSAPSAKAFSLCSFLLDQFNIIAISLECFVVAIQLLLHLKIENFVFSIDSIFALLVFSFQGASCFEGLILQNRTMNIFHEYLSQPCVEKCLRKPFVQLRCTHVFAPQTYLKPLDFFRFTKKPFVSLRDTHVFAPQTRLKIPRCILQAVCTAKF